MPFSAHSDLFSINMYPSLLFKESVFDILTYVRDNIGPNFQYYPGLTYYTFSLSQYIFQPFSDSFIPWMEKIRSLEITDVKGQVEYYIKNAPNPHVFKDLFLAKIPYLIFEVGCVAILFIFVKKKFLKKETVILWLFNPVLLYSTYVFGQMEIIPTFFLLLAFLLIPKNAKLGVLALGIAAAYKNYALVFIPPTILILGKSWEERLKLLIISMSPHLIFVLPTLINNPPEALFAFVPKSFLIYRRELKNWPLYSQIIRYALVVLSYIFIIFLSQFLRIKNKWEFSVGINLVAMILILTLAPRTHFHYLMWVVPLLFLWYKNVKTLLAIILILGISFASYKILAPQLQAGLYAPISPDYFPNLPTFNAIIGQFIPYRIISTIGFFTFFFFNFYLAVKIIFNLLFKTPIQAERRQSAKILKTQNV